MIFIREAIAITVVLSVLLQISQSAATFEGHKKFLRAGSRTKYRGWYGNHNFKCLTNETWTISSAKVCDGQFDCPDGTDEKCYHGKCLDQNYCQCAYTKKCIKRHRSHLYLLDSPKNQELHLKLGDEMILECPLSQLDYSVEMKWYRNDRGVPSKCQITTPTKTHPISRLRCLHMTQNDEGIYSCEHNYADDYYLTDAVVYVNNKRHFQTDSCYCFGATNICRRATVTIDIENVQMFSGLSSPILLTMSTKSSIITNYTIFRGRNINRISWRKLYGIVYYALSKEVIDMKLKLYGASFSYEFIPSYRILKMSHEDAPLALMRGDGKVLVYYESGNLEKISHYKRISFTKHNWHILQGNQVASSASEADVMKVLSKLEEIYLRVNYDVNDMIVENRGLDLYIRNFRYDQSGLPLSIGKCFCPPGYAGTYCEKCAVNYAGNPLKGIPCKKKKNREKI